MPLPRGERCFVIGFGIGGHVHDLCSQLAEGRCKLAAMLSFGK
jgi:hypothetical protein